MTSSVTSQDPPTFSVSCVQRLKIGLFCMLDVFMCIFMLWVLSFVLFDYDRTWRKHQLLIVSPVFYPLSFLSFHHAALSLLLASTSIKLVIFSPKCLFFSSLSPFYFNTSLFTISSIFVSFFFPIPRSKPFSQFMEEFGLQKIVSASHLQNTQTHGGNCKSATAVMIIGCQPTLPSKHT